MGMKDPLPTFITLVERVRDEHSNFAYIRVVELRVNSVAESDLTDENRAQSNEVLRKIWGDRPYIAAGGMDGATTLLQLKRRRNTEVWSHFVVASLKM